MKVGFVRLVEVGHASRSSSRCPDRMLGALRSERIAAVQGNFRKAMILFSKQSLVGYGDVYLACLSLVSGCVDVLSFVELRDLFASAMTGNTALLAVAISRGEWRRSRRRARSSGSRSGWRSRQWCTPPAGGARETG